MSIAVNIEHPTDRPNFTRVEINDLVLWFSYKTVVAFNKDWKGTIVSENIWGPTTGKHLNYISEDKSIRLPRDEFEAKLAEALG